MIASTVRSLLVIALVVVFGHVASAQSLYVAGAIGADITLVSGQESIGLSLPNGGGEAFSGAARIGVLLPPRFGIELEFSRAGEITDSIGTGGPLPLGMGQIIGGGRPTTMREIEFRRRITTVSTTASIRQQVSENVALSYLGGVVFHRTDTETNFSGFPLLAAIGDLAALGFTLPTPRFESVAYGVGPVVGFEAHIGYGDHLTFIPGVRMHGLPQTWLVRPSVAVGWTF